MEIIKAESRFSLYTGEKGKPLYLYFPLRSGKSLKVYFFILPQASSNEDLIRNSNLAYENREKKSQGER